MSNKKFKGGNQRGISSPWGIALILLGVLLLGALFVYLGRDDIPLNEETGEITTEGWVTYQNEEFNFQIEHPSDWLVRATTTQVSPMISVYKPGSVGTPPYDHFANVTHVSIYPEGIPTEGVLAPMRDSAVTPIPDVRAATDFLLEDGTPFATSLTFENPPESWMFGFVWARTAVQDYETFCRNETTDEVIPEGQCDPLGNENIEVVHTGTIVEEDRQITEMMLETLQFTENGDAGGGTDTGNELIRVNAPESNEIVESPLTVRGEARGQWYFEASFPVRLFDSAGNELAVEPAQAQGEWMTTEFVPFEVVLTFEEPATETGVLVLEKDNPSGLPENAAEVRIPVRFR